MPIETMSRYTREVIRGRPDALFVFGDNVAGYGLGGQAREARGEPNAVGIPTKWSPTMGAESFFRDEDMDDVRPKIVAAFVRLAEHLKAGGVVVVPADGVGSGLARLPDVAPKIHDYITRCFDRLRQIAG